MEAGTAKIDPLRHNAPKKGDNLFPSIAKCDAIEATSAVATSGYNVLRNLALLPAPQRQRSVQI